jgi:hypothetical protein
MPIKNLCATKSLCLSFDKGPFRQGLLEESTNAGIAFRNHHVADPNN